LNPPLCAQRTVVFSTIAGGKKVFSFHRGLKKKIAGQVVTRRAIVPFSRLLRDRLTSTPSEKRVDYFPVESYYISDKKRRKGGELDSTGVIEAQVACRASRQLVKPAGN
jgi:hypothetical protein